MWPGSEVAAFQKDVNKAKEVKEDSEIISESPSATFSSASWEAAIGAFPVFEEFNPPDPNEFKTSMDFGSPSIADSDVTEMLNPEIAADTGDNTDQAGNTSASAQTALTSSTSTTVASSDTARAGAGTTADTSLD